jgi:hypothetical protein
MKAAWLDEWFERNMRHLPGTAGSSAAAVVMSAGR